MKTLLFLLFALPIGCASKKDATPFVVSDRVIKKEQVIATVLKNFISSSNKKLTYKFYSSSELVGSLEKGMKLAEIDLESTGDGDDSQLRKNAVVKFTQFRGTSAGGRIVLSVTCDGDKFTYLYVVSGIKKSQEGLDFEIERKLIGRPIVNILRQ